MKDADTSCPFDIGDEVLFAPDERARGWSSPIFDRLHLRPGDTGIVTRIDIGEYLYLDGDRGGFHWQCFKKRPDRKPHSASFDPQKPDC
jgi:hypothetical protein